MNRFQVYAHRCQILENIQKHTEKSIGLILDIIKEDKGAVEDDDFDLLHKILKHIRSCEHQQCAPKQLAQEIRSFVLSQLRYYKKPNYPLLVCLLDLVKNNSLDDTGWLIGLGCTLWYENSIYIVRKAMELCLRAQEKIDKAESTLFTNVIQYISSCQQHITAQDITRFRSYEYTEFFYTEVNRVMTCDRECFRLLAQIVLSLLSKLSSGEMIMQLADKVQEIYHLSSSEFLPILFDICCTNDDSTTQLLNTVLLLFQEHPSSAEVIFEPININPHILFIFFIHRCGNSHDILVDLLLENDSGFLSYFYHYVVYTQKDIEAFKLALTDETDIYTIQAILANTIRVLEGGGFPYNTRPLVKRLNRLEEQLAL
ncbi:uncharacterized protein RHIMIDRAFT_280089 [Rhizopus microsporus ATCC 52813]|uniref:Protein Lines N-terminal domain-containing protein n=2 Tax=Rhizopus microsporus TaxID=58291 RepID=A0A2G4SZ30_RHIZD|nr:uncharacterized protein RHIMIDRAFT_280089 [Rhizopus microsporus ATCC 52813]PHZ13656.1 hypothetical protein RHIMIDRAFT_280089 [Rhizopus microsporus ATCC 52813]